MKPLTRGRRLIVVRGLAVVAVALVVAGCASGGSAKAGSSSVASARGLSSPIPMVSVGSPAPSDVAERSRVQAVTELARRLLADMVVAVPEVQRSRMGRSGI